MSSTRKLWDFDTSVEKAEASYKRISVLLGNGFSMAYDPGIFSYGSLAKAAALPSLSVDKAKLFQKVGSEDFETVVERLRTAARLGQIYGLDTSQTDRLKADARIVRNGLADVLSERHPQTSASLSDDAVRQVRKFLKPFDDVFTLNYDMLLYWAITRPDLGPRVVSRDGFGSLEEEIVWQKRLPQHVHFLHGALHLFVEDRKLKKLNYRQHGPMLLEVRRRIKKDKYPLIVTEGTSAEKKARIRRSAYLRTTLKRFEAINGALFIHGVSMSPNDNHIFETIESEESKVKAVYVGVHGSPTSETSAALMRRVKLMQDRRRETGNKLRTQFYDARSAHVWG